MKRYRTLTIDPPWKERGSGKCKRGADRHYKLMGKEEIAAKLIVTLDGRVESSAHAYLWVTNNFLVDGLWVLDRIGFRYVANTVWVKDRIGIGQYFRGQHEIALFGVRGKGFDVRTEARNIPSVIHAPHVLDNGKRIHSAKPDAFYEMVEKRSHGPYLDMFARRSREGWDVWGDEAPTEINQPAANAEQG